MFGTILIAACTLMQLYVFWRAASVPLVVRLVPRKVLFAAGVGLWAGFTLARLLGHGGTGALAETLDLLGLTWLVMLFLAFVPLLAVDLITGFGFFLPRTAPSLRGWALVTSGMLSMTAMVQGLRPPSIQSYEVQLPGLPLELQGTVLVAMSDLHLGWLLDAQWMDARVAQVQAQRPDLVVLLGDLFEGHGRPDEALLPVFRRLSAPLGVWAVNGNHESYGGRDTSQRFMEEAGIRVLLNRWVEVRPGFILAGVEDLTARRRVGQKGDPVSQSLAGRPPGATLFLSHTPWQAEKAAKAGASLMLSGHTHGGQVWPFDYLVRLTYPLLEGLYEVDGMPVIVSRGTGTWGPRMRLWRRSEILRVTLYRKEA